MPATDIKVFVNLVNICLGAGVLSFPWSIAGASVVGGLAIIAVGTVWCAATNVVLVAIAEKTQEYNLGRILAQLPGGRYLEFTGNFLTIGVTVLCLTGDLVIFADSFRKLVAGAAAMLGRDGLSDPALSFLAALCDGHRPLVILLGCAIVFTLGFLDLSRLAFTSGISVAANWYICFLLVGHAASAEGASPVCWLGWGVGDLTLVAVVMQAVSVQQCILPMYEEMQNRTVRRFALIQASAVVVVFVLLSGVAIAGYVLFGASVASNVLVALPHTPACLLAQALILPVVISMYPLLLYPVSVMIKDAVMVRHRDDDFKRLSEDGSGDQPHRPSHLVVLLQLSCVALTGIIAATGVDLGPINNYSGIIGLGWFTVIVPAAAYYRHWQLDGQCSPLIWAHLGLGAAVLLPMLVWQGNHLESIEAHCTIASHWN